jgi:MFS family permease
MYNTAMNKMLEKRLEANLWKYTVAMIANKRIFVAILGAYYLTIPDVTVATVGVILLAGNIAGFLLEVPSGYLSDKMGHKRALVLARILMIFSSLFLLLADSLTGLIMGSVLMSASFAFTSGTGTAFINETLRALGRDGQYAQVMGKMSAIGFAVPIILMVLIPFLVSIDYTTPFLVALVIDTIGLLVVLSLTSPPVSVSEIEEIGVTNFRQVIEEGFRLSYFSVATFSGLIGGILFAVGSFRAPYQVFLEIPVIWYGVLFGAGRAIASLILANSGRISKYFNLVSFFAFEIVLYGALLLLLGIVTEWWVVALLFIIANGVQWGFSEVDKNFQLQIIKTSKFKATLLSLRAQISSLFAGGLAFGTGYFIEATSYQTGFIILLVVSLILLLPLFFYIKRQARAGRYGQAKQ